MEDLILTLLLGMTVLALILGAIRTLLSITLEEEEP